MHLRLRDQLADDPWRSLQRTRAPFDGMTYSFSLIDPGNRLCEHFFAFQVAYSQDEETITVVNAGYQRRVGL